MNKAWEKFLFGNGKTTHYLKECDSWDAEVQKKHNGSCFIGLKTDKLKTEHQIGIQTKASPKSYMYVPFKMRGTNYECFAFENELRKITIKREIVRGKKKYYVIFTFEGKSYNKGRELGKGTVGVDIGTGSIAVVSDKKMLLEQLSKGVETDWHKLCIKQRKLDRSRRANNPQQFNENGTIKKFPKGQRPQWNESNRYKKLKDDVRELHRKVAAKRKLSHTLLSNELLSFGDTFITENNSFKGMQRRVKETKVNEKGKSKSKKRFGKSIMNHAPASLITLLDNKVKMLGGTLVKVDTKIAASQFDFTNDTFTKHGLGTRMVQLSNGKRHQRDLLAAFNLQHVIKTDDKTEAKSANNYDVEQMKKKYKSFSRREEIERERIKNNGTKRPTSFGF